MALALTPDQLAEEQLLAGQALEGVNEAWDTLIRRHNHRVVVSLLARGLSIDKAKEFAQETWSHLIRQQRLGRLSRLQLPGLAIRQAAFLALEDARRARIGEDKLAAILSLPNAGDDLEADFLNRRQLEQVQQILHDFPESTRQIFRLLYEDPERTHIEVAREVGLSVQRVRQILCEVRKKIRPLIES